ncbi:hypothetical protein ACPCHT_01605 [Nucisporomicrobium flavum]|uniref:hypothetical protein n=1 Tax=Nucisporomicrobium flavum TaxID=2785915 RepID=UPI003C2F3F4C
MTAPARPLAALLDHWHRADRVRREWLATGLSTAPADRDAAEHLLTRLYRRHGRGRPHFAWVDSPHAGLALAGGVPSHEELQHLLRHPAGRPPPAMDLAAGWSRLMARLDEARSSCRLRMWRRSCTATGGADLSRADLRRQVRQLRTMVARYEAVRDARPVRAAGG